MTSVIMDKNAYIKLNPQKCERYLSTFGKKVLGVLMKQWDKEREQKMLFEQRQISQNRRILYFNDNLTRNTLTISSEQVGPPSPLLQTYIDDNMFDLNEANYNVLNVPTSEELTSSFQTQKDIDDNKFVHPTIIRSNIVQLSNRSSDNERDVQDNKRGKNMFKQMDENDTFDVNWENMFDSDLLGDVTNDISPVANNMNNNNLSTIFAEENGKNSFHMVANKVTNKKFNEKRKTKMIGTPNTNKKPRKENTKPNEQQIKVTKTGADGPKRSFRKEKYTKTVKKWLNDVETHNTVNGEIDDDNNNLRNDKDYSELDMNKEDTYCKATSDKVTFKMTVDKSVKDTKKVVQAQLTNKDGVMKFAKPKKVEVSNAELPKDKKDKATKRFIPAIKSLIPVKDHTYEIITVDDRNIDKCYNALIEVKELIAVLVYNNGYCQLNYTDGTCSADGILLGTGEVFYYFKSTGQNIKMALIRALSDNKLVISYEARNILIYLSSYLQMEIKTIYMHDAKIGASLLDPDNSPENFSDLQKLLSYTASYTIATECTLQKAAWYMTLLKECWMKLKDMLVENQLWQIFVEIEMKLLPIIAEMEYRGVSIDLSKLKSMEEVLLSRMRLVEQECFKAAGKVFQVNSTVQVRSILYDELQLDTKCNVKIRETLAGGVKSTSETMLRNLMTIHPLPKLILEYRHLHKAHATFLAGIAQQVKDGIVRPTWVQTAAATGRIASNNPNLQAIPKTPFSLLMFPEADDNESLQLNFRSVYVSRPGCTFVPADFKHVECRVFAHAAADTGLLRALTHSEDLFRVLAAQWLNKPECTVSAAERERTKRLVYASLYGAGTRKLMEILDVSYEQALQVSASFNRTFPALKSFGRHVVSQCSQAGGRLSTLCGRMRRFVNICSEDFNVRSHAERQAVNFIIQGSAADLCKIAMILTEEQLRNTSPGVQAHLVLQIHDELVWEVNDQHVPIAAGIIKRVMEGCGQHCGMSLALPVAVTVGKSWGEMEEYVV